MRIADGRRRGRTDEKEGPGSVVDKHERRDEQHRTSESLVTHGLFDSFLATIRPTLNKLTIVVTACEPGACGEVCVQSWLSTSVDINIDATAHWHPAHIFALETTSVKGPCMNVISKRR